MKKLSLILALIFVFTCSMLAACGDDSADTSSAAESSTADTGIGTTESKAESSVAEVESSEAEVESSVAEEESSAAPVEPVELGDNVAAGKTYTISLADGTTTTTPYDTANWNANLTDGQVVEGFDDTEIWGMAAWLGLHKPDNTDASGYAYVTIDLGEVTDIAQVRLHLGNNEGLGIPAPVELYALFSEDGETFVPAETQFPIETADGGYWSELNVATSARYVQIKAFVIGSWCFLNEVEVYVPAA